MQTVILVAAALIDSVLALIALRLVTPPNLALVALMAKREGARGEMRIMLQNNQRTNAEGPFLIRVALQSGTFAMAADGQVDVDAYLGPLDVRAGGHTETDVVAHFTIDRLRAFKTMVVVIPYENSAAAEIELSGPKRPLGYVITEKEGKNRGLGQFELRYGVRESSEAPVVKSVGTAGWLMLMLAELMAVVTYFALAMVLSSHSIASSSLESLFQTTRLGWTVGEAFVLSLLVLLVFLVVRPRPHSVAQGYFEPTVIRLSRLNRTSAP